MGNNHRIDGAARKPNEIFRSARRLQAISQIGLEYSTDPYDRERFEQVGQIAMELLAFSGSHEVEGVTQLFALEKGYATPKVDVRAAVFRENRILLVRERSDGGWTLPGGWADVGDSPSHAAIREVHEESGFRVEVSKLAAIYDRDLHGHPPIPFHAYKLFFICKIAGGEARQSIETDGVAFFAEDEIPCLSTTRVTAEQVRHMFDHFRNPEWRTSFD